MEHSSPDFPYWEKEKIASGKKSKWNYTGGCVIAAILSMYKSTQDKSYLDFADSFIGYYVNDDGTIKTYDPGENNLDNINAGKNLFTLYDLTGKEKYRRAMDTIRGQLDHMPRTEAGNFWHKEIYPYQVWLDGLYMAQPYYMEYERRYRKNEGAKDIINQFKNVRKFMQRPYISQSRKGIFHMDVRAIDLFTRSASFEIENNTPYFSDGKYDIYLDGKYEATANVNVFSVFGLEPDTKYNLRIKGKDVDLITEFTTDKESAFINVRDFFPERNLEGDVTGFVEAAIMAAPRGSTIYFPKGTYRVRPLFLKSDITLYLENGAVILGDTNRENYPVLPGMIKSGDGRVEYNLSSWEGNPMTEFASLITGINVKNVSITGPGAIDGNAENSDWWKNAKIKRIAWRPKTIFFDHSENIRLQGITVKNSPSWTIHPYYCDNVRITDISIENPYDSPNTDGIDPESSSLVAITGVHISVGDDCVAVKSGKKYMAEKHYKRAANVIIKNCFFENGHGAVTAGSEISCGLSGLKVKNCLFKNTDRGLRIKTRRGRGMLSVMSGIEFSDVEMQGVRMPFTINMFYFCDPDGHTSYVQNREYMKPDEGTPQIKDITVKNVNCALADAAFFTCAALPESPVEKIRMENVTVNFRPPEGRKAAVPVMMDNFPPVSGKSIYLENVNGFNCENVIIKGSSDKEPELINVVNKDLYTVRYENE